MRTSISHSKILHYIMRMWNGRRIINCRQKRDLSIICVEVLIRESVPRNWYRLYSGLTFLWFRLLRSLCSGRRGGPPASSSSSTTARLACEGYWCKSSASATKTSRKAKPPKRKPLIKYTNFGAHIHEMNTSARGIMPRFRKTIIGISIIALIFIHR